MSENKNELQLNEDSIENLVIPQDNQGLIEQVALNTQIVANTKSTEDSIKSQKAIKESVIRLLSGLFLFGITFLGMSLIAIPVFWACFAAAMFFIPWLVSKVDAGSRAFARALFFGFIALAFLVFWGLPAVTTIFIFLLVTSVVVFFPLRKFIRTVQNNPQQHLAKDTRFRLEVTLLLVMGGIGIFATVLIATTIVTGPILTALLFTVGLLPLALLAPQPLIDHDTLNVVCRIVPRFVIGFCLAFILSGPMLAAAAGPFAILLGVIALISIFMAPFMALYVLKDEGGETIKSTMAAKIGAGLGFITTIVAICLYVWAGAISLPVTTLMIVGSFVVPGIFAMMVKKFREYLAEEFAESPKSVTGILLFTVIAILTLSVIVIIMFTTPISVPALIAGTAIGLLACAFISIVVAAFLDAPTALVNKMIGTKLVQQAKDTIAEQSQRKLEEAKLQEEKKTIATIQRQLPIVPLNKKQFSPFQPLRNNNLPKNDTSKNSHSFDNKEDIDDKDNQQEYQQEKPNDQPKQEANNNNNKNPQSDNKAGSDGKIDASKTQPNNNNNENENEENKAQKNSNKLEKDSNNDPNRNKKKKPKKTKPKSDKHKMKGDNDQEIAKYQPQTNPQYKKQSFADKTNNNNQQQNHKQQQQNPKDQNQQRNQNMNSRLNKGK